MVPGLSWSHHKRTYTYTMQTSYNINMMDEFCTAIYQPTDHGSISLINHMISDATGCPKVRVTSNHPLNFGIGGRILKPFGMVNAHTLRFGLVYHTYFYVAKCPGKYGVCSGQNSE